MHGGKSLGKPSRQKISLYLDIIQMALTPRRPAQSKTLHILHLSGIKKIVFIAILYAQNFQTEIMAAQKKSVLEAVQYKPTDGNVTRPCSLNINIMFKKNCIQHVRMCQKEVQVLYPCKV